MPHCKFRQVRRKKKKKLFPTRNFIVLPKISMIRDWREDFLTTWTSCFLWHHSDYSAGGGGGWEEVWLSSAECRLIAVQHNEERKKLDCLLARFLWTFFFSAFLGQQPTKRKTPVRCLNFSSWNSCSFFLWPKWSGQNHFIVHYLHLSVVSHSRHSLINSTSWKMKEIVFLQIKSNSNCFRF